MLGLAAVAAAVVLISHGSPRSITAEFQDARGLLVGNAVRVNGAEVGSVAAIQLTKRGTALVTLNVDNDVPLPRADATATIKPVDLLGDIYVSYSPGTSRDPLRGTIPLSRTENVPRLADLLQAFTPGAREGAQALIVALGQGLEARGVDLNQAAVAIRPALAASDRVVAELASQNADLASMVTNSDHLVAQLAARAPELANGVVDLARTLNTAAAHSTAMARGLDRLAPTMRQLTTTAGQLATTADALHPLAIQLGGIAPGLATSAAELPAFLKQATAAANATGPTVRTATTFLHRGGSTFSALTAALTSGQRSAPATADLTTTLAQVMPLISDSLFQDVASQTSEPGNEPFDPEDPLRNYWRGAAVLSCETFGLPIKPGCLAGLAPNGLIRRRTSAKRHSRPPRQLHQPATPVASQPPSNPAGTANGSGVGSVVQGLLGTVLPHGGGQLGQTSTNASGATGAPPPQPLPTLLKYLLSR